MLVSLKKSGQGKEYLRFQKVFSMRNNFSKSCYNFDQKLYLFLGLAQQIYSWLQSINPTVFGGNLKLVVVAATFRPIDYSPLFPLNKALFQGCIIATLILKLCLKNYMLKFNVLYTQGKLEITAKTRSQEISKNPCSIFSIRC